MPRLLPALLLTFTACTALPADPSDVATTTAADETGIPPSTSDLLTTGESSTSESTAFDTTTSSSRCGDQHCDDGEDAATCPDDCNVCGDGVVVGAEDCDNGLNHDAPYSFSHPSPSTCTADCQLVAFCGDGIRNGPELCDDDAVQTAGCEANRRLPVCGDSVHNLLAGEGCDDANLAVGDGCSPDCVAERRVFATSATYPGDMNKDVDNPYLLLGVELADARCNILAHVAGLPGTYKAWLSSAEAFSAARFDTSFSGRYRLLSPGSPSIAHSWHDLVDGQLDHPIDADEHGAPVSGTAWTNTLTDGTNQSDDNCEQWTYKDGLGELITYVGKTAASDSTWTSHGPSVCSSSHHLYCFEDP